ncbi:MAG: PfkB family carbohydrate kinase [Actinomycetota bacterium]
MYEFLTIGGATRDAFFEVSDGQVVVNPSDPASPKLLGFEYGSKIITEKAFFAYGGGAINTSVCLSKMDFSVAACLRIGLEGTGDILLRDVKEHGIDWRFVERDPDLHTALSVIIDVPDADRVVFQYPGANSNLEARCLEDINTGWIYLTSLTGRSVDIIPRIVSKTAAENINLVFNPGRTQIKAGYQSIKTIVDASFALMLNRKEARDLVLSENSQAQVSDIRDLVAAAVKWGSRYIVITDGIDGSFVCDGCLVYYLPRYPFETKDMTGAGDAYGAGFIAGLIKYNGDVGRSMKLATANAGSVVSQAGAHKGSLDTKAAEAIIEKNAGIEIKTMEM